MTPGFRRSDFHVSDGSRLAVYESGGDGPTVVLQHGLCGDAAQTAEILPQDPRFKYVTLECRGHGRSDVGGPRAFSIARFAEDVAELIAQMQMDQGPAVIGGISMGAAIALRLAVNRPELVRALVIARPAWVTVAAPENMAPYAEVGRLLADLPSHEARAAFAASPTARRLAAEAPDNLASLDALFDRKPHDVTAALLTSIAADGPGISQEDLRALALPTLIIGHRRDLAHPHAYAEKLARLIPGARLSEITPKAEDRSRYLADFRAALQSFLRGLFHS